MRPPAGSRDGARRSRRRTAAPEHSALSPDGRFAAVTMRRAGTARVELLLVDIDSNKSEVFAVDAISPAWSPDSRTLAYALSRPDRPPPGEFALAARRVGGPERILRPWSGESVVLPTGWTPDGQSVLGIVLGATLCWKVEARVLADVACGTADRAHSARRPRTLSVAGKRVAERPLVNLCRPAIGRPGSVGDLCRPFRCPLIRVGSDGSRSQGEPTSPVGHRADACCTSFRITARRSGIFGASGSIPIGVPLSALRLC